MKKPSSVKTLEELGRVRLSPSFFMRDFLYSEIAAIHGLLNVPDNPDLAVRMGERLCQKLLEPLQQRFGRIAIRSAYRSCTVNALGNELDLGCASNESNYARHIWDMPDQRGNHGAMACIVLPWLADHVEAGGDWRALAWWIHDHLPYSSLYFFPKLAAFNIGWHEQPERRIDSYLAPVGCLTKPGKSNQGGLHAEWYCDFPVFAQSGY